MSEELPELGYISDEKCMTPFIEEFIRYLAKDEIKGSKCRTCGRKYFPPREHCQCQSSEGMEWFDVERTGKLLTFSFLDEFGMPPASMANRVPYVVAVAELEEGLNVLCHLTGIADLPEVGMPVKLSIQTLDNGERITYRLIPA